MQMYLLAERLRRVKDAPLSEEIHEFSTRTSPSGT
jgi:hypothetical protein|tara:strand:+ start:203 stop:307 length:105 start_codon:yes stop_codon:yes gene_type:complete